MKLKIIIHLILIYLLFIGCNTDQENTVKNTPLYKLKQIDSLLGDIAEKPQQLIVSSQSATKVVGAKGTVIQVDPTIIETIDGSPLGDNIQIELLEMTDKFSLIVNNAQTVSNEQILVTGGAYYLNMTSDDKQLRIKRGHGLDVEFPRLNKEEMSLFLGERDSLGQINWISTKSSFEPKNTEDAVKMVQASLKKKFFDEFEEQDTAASDLSTLSRKELTEEEYLKKKAEYDEEQNQIEFERKTYEAIAISDFGWINCDRFYNNLEPKVDIKLFVKNDTFPGARYYAVFKDINSIMTEPYWMGRKDTVTFRSIPTGSNLTIIALSVKDKTPFIFESTFEISTSKAVKVEFTPTTQREIIEKFKNLN